MIEKTYNSDPTEIDQGANVFRDPYRSGLNLLSLTIAFLLFTLQRTLAVAFGGDIDLGDIDRLYVIKKQQQSQERQSPTRKRTQPAGGTRNENAHLWLKKSNPKVESENVICKK